MIRVTPLQAECCASGDRSNAFRKPWARPPAMTLQEDVNRKRK
jgi:hypothetical protein